MGMLRLFLLLLSLPGFGSAALGSTAAVAQVPAGEPRRPLGAGEYPVSPAVWSTWLAQTEQGTPVYLELVVLWRGSPNWHRALMGGSSRMGPAGEYEAHYRLGERSLQLRFNPQSRTVWVGEQRIELGSANVLLVDQADDPGGPTVLGTARVDPQLPAPADPVRPYMIDLPAVLHRERQLRAFLR